MFYGILKIRSELKTQKIPAYWSTILSLLLLAVTLQSCDKEVYVEPKSDSVIDYSQLFISSNPTGATIYINGKTTGLVTPDTIKWVTEGAYLVTLKRQYYLDTTFSINAVNNKTVTGYVDYTQSEKMLGSMNCTSVPAGVKIFMDNVYTGRITPYTFTKLLPKVYSIRYEYPEYRKDSADVIVRSSVVSTCGITMDDTLDVINYNMANSKLPSNDIKCLAEDRDGSMWFGTSTDGLLKFDGKKFSRYTVDNASGVTSNVTRRIIKDKENILWFGFSNSIVKYDGTNWTAFPVNMVASLKVSRDNTIIAAINRDGLFEYSSGNIKRIHTTDGLKDNDVFAACIDNDGMLWAGIYMGGIDTYYNGEWKHFTSIECGSYNSTLECDQDGVMFGIFRNTLEVPRPIHTVARYENGKWNGLFTTTALFSYDNIYVDNKNGVWFGLNGGIYRIVNKSVVKNMASIVKSSVRKLKTGPELVKYTSGAEAYVDSKGNLWIIGSPYGQGIIKVKSGRWDY